MTRRVMAFHGPGGVAMDFVRVLLVSIVSVGLAACGGDGEHSAPDPSTDAALTPLVSDARLEITTYDAPIPHGNHDEDLPYLRSGCGPFLGAESEPVDPWPDADDEYLAWYRPPPPLASVEHLRHHPSGTLALRREGGIWISAADGRRRRRLLPAPFNGPGETMAHGPPSWAFQGEELVFVTTHGEPRGRIIRFDPSCEYANPIGIPICDSLEKCFLPAETVLRVSPDGNHVLYVGQTAQGEELRRLDLRGRTVRVIAKAERISDPVWSPSGQLVAFEQFDTKSALVVVDLRTGARDSVARGCTWCRSPGFGVNDGTLLYGATEFSIHTSTEVRRIELPDLRSHAAKGPSIDVVTVVTGMGDLARSPTGARFALHTFQRLGGFGAPSWSRLRVGSSTATGVVLSELFSGSVPHHGARSPVFSPDDRLVAFDIRYCFHAACTRRRDRIVISDDDTSAFVGLGEVSDWTARVNL